MKISRPVHKGALVTPKRLIARALADACSIIWLILWHSCIRNPPELGNTACNLVTGPHSAQNSVFIPVCASSTQPVARGMVLNSRLQDDDEVVDIHFELWA